MCLTGVMLAAVECMLSEDENLVLAATSAVRIMVSVAVCVCKITLLSR
jgi:hypothetical protein